MKSPNPLITGNALYSVHIILQEVSSRNFLLRTHLIPELLL